MADETGLPSLDGAIDKLIAGLSSPGTIQRLQIAIKNAHAEGATVANAAAFRGDVELAADEHTMKGYIESLGGWLSSWFLSLVVENTFDVPIDNVAFAQFGATHGRHAVAKKITDKMVQGLTGGSTSVEPSQQPAANYLSTVFGQVFEAWAIGEMIEIASAVFPKIEKIEHVADLGDKLVAAMGITDSSARVLRPYIDNLVVEPLRRYIATTYRPALLSESMAVRQFQRGKITRAELDKELAEQGWSPAKIEAHINANEKFLGFSDAVQLARGGGWSADDVVTHLKDQGYSERVAWGMWDAERRQQINAIWARVLTPALSAFANRDITSGDLRNTLTAIVEDTQERDLWFHVGELLREFNVRHLSHGEIRDAVKVLALPMAAYRQWLEREGYPESDAFTLELLLRAEIDKEHDIEEHRAAQEAERAAEKKARADAAALRKQEVDAQRALARRGSTGDLERAVIRGLIPMARLEEVLTASYDVDTVAILVGLVEGDRLAYLDEQQRRADALKRAEVRGIDVGALESAVMENVLTLQEFRARLGMLKFTDADADLLTATLDARKADIAAARAKRDAAEAEAKRRSIDLGRVEQLIVRGVHTLAEYDALLQAWGFDAGSRAAMVELVQLKINDAAVAAAERKAAEERLKNKGLSLEQFTRAVILKTKTEDDYARFLIAEHFTADAQIALMAQLRADVAEAEAARRKRAEAEAASQARAVPLSELARAARLGVVSPATYQARLRQEHYTADDIAIEMQLLVTEIAEIQAARAKRDELEALTKARGGLSLAQVERAVKTGVSSIEDYRARAASLYPPADVQVLVDVLAAELQTLADARARRAAIEAELGTRQLSLTQLEAAVKGGLATLDDYVAGVQALGYDADDAALLATLLLDQLTAGTEAP